MNRRPSFRRAALTVFLMAGVQLTLQVSLLARGVDYVATSLAIDDTYYYLQTAWNTRVLGFVTFDGLHPTNGVQLAWFAAILLLAFLIHSKATLLLAALAVSFLLNSFCYAVILKIAAVVQRPGLAVLLAGLWALQCLPFRIYSMGMENSLHALVFWCVLWQSAEFLVRVRRGLPPNLWGLTLLLILNVWTRLDAGLLSAVVYAFCLAQLGYAHWKTTGRVVGAYAKAVAASGLTAGFGLILQLGAFQVMGGAPLPVSAMVKTAGVGRGLSLEAGAKLVEVLLLGMPSVIQGRLPALALVLLGMAGILALLVAWARWPKPLADLRPMADLWGCLLIGELLYHVYIAVSGVQYVPYFLWYRSPSFIFWILTGTLLVFLVIEAVTHNRLARLPAGFTAWSTAGLSVASFGIALYLFARSLNFASDLYTVRLAAARWIGQHYPAGTIFAAWNTGQLGYFSDQTFINLDGVINSVDYYERVLRDAVPLTQYLHENNVEYVVDYATYDALPVLPVVHSFPLDDGSGRAITIWQVPPLTSQLP